jgi:hypothetical protein
MHFLQPDKFDLSEGHFDLEGYYQTNLSNQLVTDQHDSNVFSDYWIGLT